nr:hypothetical protein [Chthonobacter rhizosphaerae]
MWPNLDERPFWVMQHEVRPGESGRLGEAKASVRYEGDKPTSVVVGLDTGRLHPTKGDKRDWCARDDTGLAVVLDAGEGSGRIDPLLIRGHVDDGPNAREHPSDAAAGKPLGNQPISECVCVAARQFSNRTVAAHSDEVTNRTLCCASEQL